VTLPLGEVSTTLLLPVVSLVCDHQLNGDILKGDSLANIFAIQQNDITIDLNDCSADLKYPQSIHYLRCMVSFKVRTHSLSQ
jgi:hypothetical protein